MYREDEEARREYDEEVWFEKRMERISELMEEFVLAAMLSALEKIKDRGMTIDVSKPFPLFDKNEPF